MAKGKVVLRQDVCKACELCASVCPQKVLALDEKAVNKKSYHPIAVVNAEACVGCGNCALICPDGVISVYRED